MRRLEDDIHSIVQLVTDDATNRHVSDFDCERPCHCDHVRMYQDPIQSLVEAGIVEEVSSRGGAPTHGGPPYIKLVIAESSGWTEPPAYEPTYVIREMRRETAESLLAGGVVQRDLFLYTLARYNRAQDTREWLGQSNAGTVDELQVDLGLAANRALTVSEVAELVERTVAGGNLFTTELLRQCMRVGYDVGDVDVRLYADAALDWLSVHAEHTTPFSERMPLAAGAIIDDIRESGNSQYKSAVRYKPIWQHLSGGADTPERVATLLDVLIGAGPQHPETLKQMAQRLADTGWDFKHIAAGFCKIQNSVEGDISSNRSQQNRRALVVGAVSCLRTVGGCDSEGARPNADRMKAIASIGKGSSDRESGSCEAGGQSVLLELARAWAFGEPITSREIRASVEATMFLATSPHASAETWAAWSPDLQATELMGTCDLLDHIERLSGTPRAEMLPYLGRVELCRDVRVSPDVSPAVLRETVKWAEFTALPDTARQAVFKHSEAVDDAVLWDLLKDARPATVGQHCLASPKIGKIVGRRLCEARQAENLVWTTMHLLLETWAGTFSEFLDFVRSDGSR